MKKKKRKYTLKADEPRTEIFYVRTKKRVALWLNKRKVSGKFKSMADMFEKIVDHVRHEEEGQTHVGGEK